MTLGRRDVLFLLVLAAACVLLRAPGLDRIALNPDESQYEATAAYLLATGDSPFSIPYGTVTTIAVYEAVARAFGPYSMFAVRLLVLAICWLTAFLLYAIVRDATDGWAGLVAGLVFLHYAMPFEGWTANREWFSGLPLIVAAWLFATSLNRPPRPATVLLFASGISAGIALWFKLQVAPIVLVVPAMLLVTSRGSRPMQVARLGAAYGVGVAVALVAHFLPFAWAGTLPVYLASIATRWTSYVVGSDAVVRVADPGGPAVLWDRFVTHLPSRPLLLVSYGAAVSYGIAAVSRLFRRRPVREDSRDGTMGAMFALYLVAAMVAIGMGNRYFAHYYLLMVPAVGALSGLAFHRLRTARRARPWPQLGAGLLVVVVVALVVRAQLAPPPTSLPNHRDGFAALAADLHRRAAPGDRLFVWGWVPEIYSVTRMEPASHFTNCQYVVNDYEADPEPSIQPDMARLLMRDLERRPPAIVVDASRRSYTMERHDDPWIYDLDLYPEFAFVRFLRDGYDKVATLDGCDVWIRRRPGPPSRPA